MPGPGDPSDEADRRLTIYVVAWVAGAAVMTAGTLLADVPGITDGPADVALAVTLGLAGAILGVVHVRVPLRGTLEASNLTEAAYVPLMVLLPPDIAVITVLGAALVSESYLTRGQPRKLLFNVAWVATGVTAGSWLYHLIAPAFESRPVPLGTALLAGAVLVAVNLGAFSGVIALRSGRSWLGMLSTEAPSSVVLGFGTATLGVLVAVLVVHAPMALPVLLVPVLLLSSGLRARSVGHEQLALERSRLQRTVGGATDGIALLDADGRVVVWNPRMVELTGVAPERARNRRLSEIGCAELDTHAPPNGEAHRLTLGQATVEVRATTVATPDPARPERVLSVHDITRETELTQLREDLVMRVSHELRTPLTTLSGFVETLQARWDTLDEDQRRALLEAAGRGSRRLSHLVTNLMVWARIEVISRGPQPQDAALRPTVLEVVEELPVAADVTVEVPPDLSVAMAAADLYLVVANLVENAVLYGRPPVRVTATSDRDGWAELSVVDHGDGLPAERAAALYEPFEQHSQGLTRTAKGLGMGLAVVRALVTQSGGDVRYEPSPAGGARFVATLPTGGRGGGPGGGSTGADAVTGP